MSILLAALQKHQATSSYGRDEINENRLSLGSVVVVRSGFGTERPETVTLQGYEEDGKNGRATVNYTDRHGKGRWAYTDQIIKVISY